MVGWREREILFPERRCVQQKSGVNSSWAIQSICGGAMPTKSIRCWSDRLDGIAIRNPRDLDMRECKKGLIVVYKKNCNFVTFESYIAKNNVTEKLQSYIESYQKNPH